MSPSSLLGPEVQFQALWKENQPIRRERNNPSSNGGLWLSNQVVLPPMAPFSPGGPGIPSCPWFPLGPAGPGSPGAPLLPENDEMLNSLRGPFLTHVRLPDDINNTLFNAPVRPVGPGGPFFPEGPSQPFSPGGPGGPDTERQTNRQTGNRGFYIFCWVCSLYLTVFMKYKLDKLQIHEE